MAWKVAGFEPVHRIGSGSTGTLVKARDMASGTDVAIKYLSKNVAGGDGFRDRFEAYGPTLARIDHPHVAQVYGYVDEGHGPATVTEFIDGVSVRSILSRGGALPAQAALYVVKAALTGLAEAHRRGVVHGDVTPGNLIVDRGGTVKVVDFGVAARHGGHTAPSGTPAYLAPERWAGQAATAASDIFASTVILLEALTGVPARSALGGFIGDGGPAGSDRPIVAPPADLPDRVRAMLTRGLAHRASARYATADAMADAIVFAAVGGYGFDWEAVGRQQVLDRIAHPGRRNRAAAGSIGSRRVWAVSALALVVVAAAAFAVAGGVFRSKSPVHLMVAARASASVPAPTPFAPGTGTPLSAPTGLRVTSRSQTAVSLSWMPAQDDVRVHGYVVVEDTRRIATVSVPGFTVLQLSPGTTYQFAVIAVDGSNNLSPASPIVVVATLSAPDTAPPTVPTGLRSTGRTPSAVVLAWNPARDNVGIAGYAVLRDGRQIASVVQPGYSDTGLTAATAYQYSVRAYDATGNDSRVTAPITVTTLTGPDTIAPTPPRYVKATATGTSTVHIAWTEGSDNVGVTGYQILRNGVRIAMSASPQYDDYGLAAATTYRYTIKSVDAAGHPSAPSPAATATTNAPAQPSPTPTPTATATQAPQPQVTGVSISAASVSTTTCTTILTVTVTAGVGLPSADIRLAITGVPAQTITVGIGTGGTGVATVDSVDGTADGTATVTALGTPYADSTSWTAPPVCVPQPSPAPSTTDAVIGSPAP
jgi:eukaryotic-like serine/threonine-protein kinase